MTCESMAGRAALPGGGTGLAGGDAEAEFAQRVSGSRWESVTSFSPCLLPYLAHFFLYSRPPFFF